MHAHTHAAVHGAFAMCRTSCCPSLRLSSARPELLLSKGKDSSTYHPARRGLPEQGRLTDGANDYSE